MRVRLKYLWSNRHRMTFMPGIGEFFTRQIFFKLLDIYISLMKGMHQIEIPHLIMTYIIRYYTCSKKIFGIQKIYFLAKISYIFYLLIFLKAVCCSRVISNLALHFRLFFFTITCAILPCLYV